MLQEQPIARHFVCNKRPPLIIDDTLDPLLQKRSYHGHDVGRHETLFKLICNWRYAITARDLAMCSLHLDAV